MRFIFLVLSILLLASCSGKKTKATVLTGYIPQDASIIFSIKNLDVFISNLNNNELLKDNTKFHLIESTRNALHNLQYLKTPNEVLLAFSRTGTNTLSFTLVTKQIPNLIHTDSIQNKKVETFTYSQKTIQKYTLENSVTYATSLDGVFVVSDSQILVENVIRNYKATVKNPVFKDLLESSGNGTSAIIKMPYFANVFQDYFSSGHNFQLQKFTDVISVDLEISQQSIQLNGVAKSSDSIPKILDIFKGNNPQEHLTASVVPVTATGFYSFTYADFSKLRNAIKLYHRRNRELKPLKNEPLFNSAKEIGVIYHNDAPVLVLHSIDPQTTNQALIAQTEEALTFRDVTIFKYDDPEAFSEAFNPLITDVPVNFYTSIGNQFLFSETIEALESVIANVQNTTVLARQDFYQDLVQSLSDEGSILFVANLDEFQNTLQEVANDAFKPSIKTLKLKDHKLAALQFVYERDFAHVHSLIEKAGAKSTSQGIAQVAATQLDNPIRMEPQLFKNHTNGTKDVVVQDAKNVLYLLSNNGKIRWKKELSSAILGSIEEVDLYRNGRVQLAFTTQDKFYILDRNGKNVANFPISYKDAITQPLAVFDYDNNRKYRFIVTQGDTVLMYNKDAKRVTGFKFSDAGDPVINPPQHIRIGSKDYILIMTDSGKLHILSRTGSNRVNIQTNLDLSDNIWYKYKNSFASTNENGELMLISESGKLSIEKLNLPQEHYITSTNATFVSLADNKLTIKGKTLDLDFGLYSRPKIFYIDNKIYVTVTDTQSHKVYLFDSNGILRPNFPVYGNSVIDLGNMDKDSSLEFVVKGEEDSVLIYKIN